MENKVRRRTKDQSRRHHSKDKNNFKSKRKTTDTSLISRLRVLVKPLAKCLSIILIIVLIVLILSPFVFRYSLTVRRLLVFMNYINYPLFKNLSDPINSYGMNCTRNLFITHEDNNQTIRLGVWHILPKSRTHDCPKHINSEQHLLYLDDNRPIFLYLHGNGGARGGHHRRQLYEVLSKSSEINGHVVTFDYRGYGDSSDIWPTAEGLRSDANAVYYWLLSHKNVNKSRIIVYGHSLGTAVSIKFVSKLPKEDSPHALVLESPFTSIGEAIQWHPFSKLFRKFFPYFEDYFVKPIVENEITNFDSISLLSRIEIPLLILHSEDDGIVPFHLGHKLYEHSLKVRSKNSKKTQMIAFNGEYGYGHKYIFRDPELPLIIEKFLKS